MKFERTPSQQSPERQPSYGLVDVEATAKGDEDLETLYDMVEQGVNDYYQRTLAFVRSMSRDTPRKYVEEIDHAKRLTHNALVSNLTALARNAKAQGRTALWWNGPGGFCKGRTVDRHIIAEWAVKEASRSLQLDLQTRE